ncbi:MAG: DUF3047 domain-containing protein [Desulfobacterales bacterium]|nr:DUF3047 domain-containing protein [Desulfobacterales bacterium]
MAFFCIHPAVLAESPPSIEVGRFSNATAEDALPLHWEIFSFKGIQRHTIYRLVEENGMVVLKADADASASGLMRKIRIDPKEYPIIQWRWKVANVLKKGNVYQKDGDDYPARIYVVFEYDPSRLSFSERIQYKVAKKLYGEYPPSATINYIWASSAPKGLFVPNPYTERAMMVVIEIGEKHSGTWISERRNIYEDFLKSFNSEPPMISSVAIMTDTDNTGESATAYYGNILFSKE